MIERADRPASGGMATVARLRSDDMGRTFAGGDGTVVAVLARVRGLTMIEGYQHRNPDVGGMTGFTHVAGQRMSAGFIRPRTHSVMTTGRGARLPRNGGMIERTDRPASGGMTTVARLRGHDMGRAFAGGNGAVVTVLARVHGLAMIERYQHRNPNVGGMTSLAEISGYRMGSGFVRRICAGMTCRASIGGLVMWERDNEWRPNIRGMTGIALFTGQWMSTGFVCSGADTIMTA